MKQKFYLGLFALLVMSCDSGRTNANNNSSLENLPDLEKCNKSIYVAKFDCMEANTHFREKYKTMTYEQVIKTFVHVPEQCNVTEKDVYLYTYCAVNDTSKN